MEISQTSADSFDLLTLVAETAPVTASGLAARAGISDDTCERRLRTFERRGYVVRRSDDTWRLGPRLRNLAARIPDRLTLAAKDQVDRLAQLFSVGVVLATASPPNFTIRMERSGVSGPTRVEHFSGVEFALWQAPPGLALLSGLDDESLQDTLERAPDAAALHSAIDSVRDTGIVVARSDLMTGRTGIAAPVTLADGSAIASLTLACAEYDPEDLDDMRAQLLSASARVADRYGQLSMGAPTRRRARSERSEA